MVARRRDGAAGVVLIRQRFRRQMGIFQLYWRSCLALGSARAPYPTLDRSRMISRIGMRFFILLACWATVLWLAPAAWAQQPDLSSLVHPDVAERLSLDDAQRVSLQQLLQARAEALATAPDASAKTKAATESEQKILAVLNDEQRKKFAAELAQTKLMFQFREMKWDDVLNWFAGQQDLDAGHGSNTSRYISRTVTHELLLA